MIRILIADDHVIVRKGLKQILDDTTDITVVTEAGSSREVLVGLEKYDLDVILLDISMPGQGGIELIKSIRSIQPEQKILVLSMHPEEMYAIRALRAGASGYLTKESAPDELIAAVRKVAGGGKYISATLGERLASQLGVDLESPRHERLSDREYQVLIMIASGRSVSEIAQELSLSQRTISTFRSRLLKKMDMKNNMELTKYALINNLTY